MSQRVATIQVFRDPDGRLYCDVKDDASHDLKIRLEPGRDGALRLHVENGPQARPTVDTSPTKATVAYDNPFEGQIRTIEEVGRYVRERRARDEALERDRYEGRRTIYENNKPTLQDTEEFASAKAQDALADMQRTQMDHYRSTVEAQMRRREEEGQRRIAEHDAREVAPHPYVPAVQAAVAPLTFTIDEMNRAIEEAVAKSIARLGPTTSPRDINYARDFEENQRAQLDKQGTAVLTKPGGATNFDPAVAPGAFAKDFVSQDQLMARIKMQVTARDIHAAADRLGFPAESLTAEQTKAAVEEARRTKGRANGVQQ